MKEHIRFLWGVILSILCFFACTNKQEDIELFLKKEIVKEFANKGIDAKILKNSLKLFSDGEGKFKGSVSVVIDNEVYEHDLSVLIEEESVQWQMEETEASVKKRAQKREELQRQETQRQEMAQRRLEETQRREEKERHRYDWLQGHWYYNTSLGTHHVIIDGNRIFESLDDDDYDVNTFKIENGRLGYMWQGMYVYFDIDERNKRIGCDGQYYRKANNSYSIMNAYDSRDQSSYSPMFHSSQDVYARLLNQSFHGDGMTIKFDSTGQIYFGSQWVSRGFTVSNLSEYSATINFRFELDGSMTRLRVVLEGNTVVLIDPVDGTRFR